MPNAGRWALGAGRWALGAGRWALGAECRTIRLVLSRRQGPGSAVGRQIDWLEFKDARAAVVDDVRTSRSHPLVPKRIPIYGYIYNVKTGQLEEVPEATKIGA